MTSPTPTSSPTAGEALVRASFDAFRAGDRAAQERLLAPDFTFTSPYDDAIDRDAYFARCWPNHEQVGAFQIEQTVERDGGVFVTYLFTTKRGTSFRNTEYFTVAQGQITSVNVYFGASYEDGTFKAKTPG